MATSTFYRRITIDEKAADIIIKGLNSPRPPKLESTDSLERGEKLLKQFLSNCAKSSTPPEK